MAEMTTRSTSSKVVAEEELDPMDEEGRTTEVDAKKGSPVSVTINENSERN